MVPVHVEIGLLFVRSRGKIIIVGGVGGIGEGGGGEGPTYVDRSRR